MVQGAPVEVVGVVVPRARLLRLGQRDVRALAHVLDIGRALGDVLDAHLGTVRVRVRIRAPERRAVRRVKYIAVKLPSRLVRARIRITNQS